MLVIGLCLGFARNGIGASFNVNPIGFKLTAERSSGLLQIRNTGDAPVRLQVSAVDWLTDGRQEILQDTNAILLNPPIFSIAPGQIQFLRFGLREPARSDTEQAYRLLVEEVPPGGPQGPGLMTLLRVSIPVFIAPQETQEKLTWQIRRGETGLVLAAVNEGNVHGKIIQIRLNNPDLDEGLHIRTPAYILAGQRKEWPLESGKIHAGKVRLKVQTDKAEIEEYLMLDTDEVPGSLHALLPDSGRIRQVSNATGNVIGGSRQR